MEGENREMIFTLLEKDRKKEKKHSRWWLEMFEKLIATVGKMVLNINEAALSHKVPHLKNETYY